MNSIRFAWLAANKKFNPYKERIEWFKEFSSVMGILFWNIESDSFFEYHSPSESFTLADVSIQLLKNVSKDIEVGNVAQKTLDAFKKLPNTNSIVEQFHSNSTSGTYGNFQLDIATQDSNGNVLMVLCAMNFESTNIKERFLFTDNKSESIKLFLVAQNLVLNEKLYGQIRQDVIDKLRRQGHDGIANIVI